MIIFSKKEKKLPDSLNFICLNRTVVAHVQVILQKLLVR
jgi:hypothetical protein